MPFLSSPSRPRERVARGESPASHAHHAALGVAPFVPGAEEFGLFLNLYDALVARFGVAADERFYRPKRHHQGAPAPGSAQQYNAADRARPRTDPELVAAPWLGPHTCGTTAPVDGLRRRVKADRARGRRTYLRAVSGGGAMIPAKEAKGRVYRELGYRPARHGRRAPHRRPPPREGEYVLDKRCGIWDTLGP